MMTKDEKVAARCAALKLERLYHAYRASSRANAMVLNRIQIELSAQIENPDLRLQKQRQVIRNIALSKENDAVFALRIAQLEGRIAELDTMSSDT